MSSNPPDLPPAASSQDNVGLFPKTRWSLIQVDSSAEDKALHQVEELNELCKIYWEPCYFWLRRSGKSKEDAEDLVQGFFTYILNRDWLSKADAERGKFRSFLLKSLSNYTSDCHRFDNAKKRGGEFVIEHSDFESKEKQLNSSGSTAEEIFDRRWALLTLQQAIEALRSRYKREGKSSLFQELSPFLEWNQRGTPQTEIAAKVNLSPGAFRVALKRMRTRLRKEIEAQILQTVSDESALEEEVNHMINSL